MSVQTFDASREEFATILNAVREDGCAVLKNLLPARAIERIAQEIRPHFDRAAFGDGQFCGYKTKRIGSIGRKSGTAIRMLGHPLIVSLMQELLGPYCDRIQLNLTQGINIYPGEAAQVIHRDDGMFPATGFTGELMTNVLWALDDIAPENGSTRVVVGSHRWDRDRMPEKSEIEQVRLMKGDALLYLGSLIHGGGPNSSTKERPAVVFGYNLGWLKAAEAHFLVFPPEVAKLLPRRVQELVGYSVHRPNCGLYECEDPRLLLDPPRRQRLTSRDYFTPEQTKLMHEILAVVA